jgi:serine/threonine-protein kinase
MMASPTQAGIILGTAGYMAPEQARGNDVEKRADIWASGVVLYEMLTCKRLFDGPTISDSLHAPCRTETMGEEADNLADVVHFPSPCLHELPTPVEADQGKERRLFAELKEPKRREVLDLRRSHYVSSRKSMEASRLIC